MTLVDLGKRLLDASKKGDTGEIRSLMSGGAPFTTDWLGTSPLHFASMNGHTDTVTILLRAGISRDARTKVDRTPLHVSSQNGHFDIVKILVSNNAIVDACDMLKMTPLHWAVENGHTNIVNLLLKHSADTTIVDKFDRTPMEIAMSNMQMDIVQLLQNASQQVRTAASVSTIQESGIVEEEVMTDGILSSEPTLQSTVQWPKTKCPLSAWASLGTSPGSAPENNNYPVPKSESDPDEPATVSGPSVLSALAVLAEATASGNSANTTTTRLHSNTPFTLTEAGKLALNNYFKENGMSEDDHQVVTLVDEQGNQVLVVQSNQESSNSDGVEGDESQQIIEAAGLIEESVE